MTANFVIAQKAMTLAQPEEDVLEAAVREHARPVYRIAYSVLRNAAEAEDVVQEVFLRALRYGKKLAGVNDRKAWLAQIAWRVAAEQRQRGARDANRGELPVEETLPSADPSAEHVLLERERGEVLQQVIAALPEQLRDSLALSAMEELSPREIGAMLGISEAAVRARAFRARQILRERIEARMGVGR
ncbi:MAG TPA: RNA polymerase sigma factor [Terriglobales bacterium]|nr:RNA polymerase sigma factor [Terriglobales bacterium]